MKITKLSLIACVALASLSTASFAQPLEEAIKGIDVSGMLRYRYTDNRYDNKGFNKQERTRGDANHQWRAEALFKTPVINNISMNLGIGYHNAQQNVNHGKGATADLDAAGEVNIPFAGNGLGSGSDSWFGVREFNMVITPDSTNTTIKAGKMIMQTPLNDTLDDRATGIFVTNSDLNHWTFSLGAFDAWSIDDYQTGYSLSSNPRNNQSFAKPFYTIGALSNYDTSIGNFSSQLWFFNATDMIDFAGFGELAWQNSMFHLKGQYAFSKLNSDANSPWTSIYEHKVKEANDLYTLEAGVRFHDYNIPVAAKIGYWGNTQDGYAVSLDDEGSFQKVGQIWFENGATGVSISMLPTNGQKMPRGFESNELSMFYANINYDILENLNIGIDYVNGTNKIARGQGAARYSGDIDFQEINPYIVWQYTKSLRIFAHYSILTTDATRQIATAMNNTLPAEQISDSEDRNRLRVEVKYTF